MVKGINVAGLYKCVTNLPLNDASVYGYDFTRWIVKIPGGYVGPTYYVSQTHEVLVDDNTGTDAAVHNFYMRAPRHDHHFRRPTARPASCRGSR